MAATKRLICRGDQLVECGDGVRFEVLQGERLEPAFVVRFMGEVHGYINRCMHIPYELDWSPGKFFDSDGLVLICSVHGASYDASTGQCIGGPCYQGLTKLIVEEIDGAVYLAE
jgi:nitrite reductase/ring-hydroxylating ferredoxin subunit